MNKLKISVLQNDIVWENPAQNIEKLNKYLSSLDNVDVLVLPEMFNTGFTNKVSDFGESLKGISVKFLKQIAKEKNMAVCTSLILAENEKYYNAFLFVKPDGEIIRYNKRHLFKMGGENEMFTAGKERVVVEYKNAKILLQVCYDLRFPVWSRNKNDYDLIIYIANWPKNRRHVYDSLLRARAIENQSFVVAANRIGIDGNSIQYDGGSCIIDYKGDFIAHAKNQNEEIIISSLDLDEQNLFKQRFPAWDDADDFEIL